MANQRRKLTQREKAVNHDTWTHIHRVQELMRDGMVDLLYRMLKHDDSKLRLPEVATFVKYTAKLHGVTYGSPKYKRFLKEMQKDCLAHHYRFNSHHPECHENGVNDMTLMDLIEMVCDWKAATERHVDGDIMRSIKINKKRFKISPQLARILVNTVREKGWDDLQDRIVAQIRQKRLADGR